MITASEAIKMILDTTPKRPVQVVDISNAINRVLAQNIYASRNQPPFDRVMMDGIAINTQAQKKEYPIEAIQAAGSPPIELSSNKNCIEVMTGAMLPKGCDCVIPYENILISENQRIAKINITDIKAMKNIHPKSSDYEKGDLLLKKGSLITSPVLAIIASQGRKENLSVYSLPTITVISTGSELIEPGQRILEHQIFMSNSYAIVAELKALGIIDVKRLHITDQKEILQLLIENALNQSDILILTGGVSKGKFDYIPQVLAELGVKKHYHKVKQKPGKPMWYGTKNQKQVFALPGNPVSCLICLRRYITPSLLKMQNRHEKPNYGVLQENIIFKNDFTLFKPVSIDYSNNGELLLRPLISNGSGDFSSLANSDGFIELPPEREVFKKGDCFQFFAWQK